MTLKAIIKKKNCFFLWPSMWLKAQYPSWTLLIGWILYSRRNAPHPSLYMVFQIVEGTIQLLTLWMDSIKKGNTFF